MREAPALKRIQAEFKDKDLQVVAINLKVRVLESRPVGARIAIVCNLGRDCPKTKIAVLRFRDAVLGIRQKPAANFSGRKNRPNVGIENLDLEERWETCLLRPLGGGAVG